MFGDLVWLLVHSLILGEGLVALASWAGSDLQPMAFRLGLIGSAVLRLGWADDYSHFCHRGLMTSNQRFELMPSSADPIELLLAGGLIFVLFQSLAHLPFVCYYEPIISPRNQLF